MDDLMPRSCVLQIPDRVDYRRPTMLSGNLLIPAGVSMVQVLWQGDASLTVFPDGGPGSIIGEWAASSWRSGQPGGQYPLVRFVTDAPLGLGIQARNTSVADLSRHIAVSIYPLPTTL